MTTVHSLSDCKEAESLLFGKTCPHGCEIQEAVSRVDGRFVDVTCDCGNEHWISRMPASRWIAHALSRYESRPWRYMRVWRWYDSPWLLRTAIRKDCSGWNVVLMPHPRHGSTDSWVITDDLIIGDWRLVAGTVMP